MRSRVILSLILGFVLSVINADEIVKSVTHDCTLVSSQEYMQIGDVDSKDIFAKTDYTYECNTTVVKQGPCTEWESQNEDYNASYRQNVAFKDEDFSKSSGEMFNLITAYNGLEYIWGGWKGICTDGTVTDFSWASDPLYWASLVSSAFSDNDIAREVANATDVAVTTVQYMQCATQAAIGIGSALIDYYDDDEVACDPVDEFCGENDEDKPDQVTSMDIQTWEDALAANPKLAEYTQVLSNDGEIVVVRFTPKDTNGMMPDEVADAAKEAKEMMLTFKAVIAGIDAAVCVGKIAMGYGGGSGTTTPSGQSATSAGAVVSRVVGQFNPIVGAAINLAIQIASSFQNIDTCRDKDDAQERGSRHLKTYTHKMYGMCHLYRIEKDIESSWFTDYDNYHYCCYPDVVARILSEQIKAQLARGWSHCTDITFKDLEDISFRSCTIDEIGDIAYVDGKTIPWDASVSQREKAFQFQHRCLDYRDLEEYLVDRFGENVSQFNLEEQMGTLQDSNFSAPSN